MQNAPRTFRESPKSRMAIAALFVTLLAALLLPGLADAATISGTVRKLSDSTAIANVKVYWLSGNVRTDSATTDALGAYTLENVATGFGIPVQAEAAGYALGTASVNLFQSTSSATANFYLGIPGTLRGAVLKGSDSLPLVGASVYLRRSSQNSAILDSTVSGAGGAYAFTGVAPGTPNYWVTATATGFAATTNANVAVGNGDTATSDIYIQTLGGIAGTVRNLSDSTGIADALVLLRQGGSDTSPILDSTRTNGSGAYAFANLTASTTGGFGGNTTYRVYASASGRVDASMTGIAVSNGMTTIADFYLGASASVSGTVRKAADSTVIAGASVYLRRSSAEATVLDSTVTDSLGHYVFTGVAPGSPNYWISAAAANLATGTLADVSVGSGASVISNFYLAPILPGSISGTVLKAADSTAVAGATVYLRRTSANSAVLDSTVSGPTGAYSFTGLEAGSPNYFLAASAAGFASATASNIVVNNGANTVSNLYLATLGGIAGTVRKLSDSTVVANAKVLLRRGNSDTSPLIDSAVTDANGAYAFTGLAASTGGGFGGSTAYRVYASATGFATASVTNVSVSNGNVTTANLYLGLPGTLTGTVRGLPDSTVLAGVLVQLRTGNFGGSLIDSVRTNVAGVYVLPGLSPATNYQITASLDGFVTATLNNVAVTSGATVVSNIVLAAAGRGVIAGKVGKAADSTALAGALVVLRRGSDSSAVVDSARTDSLGHYAFTGVLAGFPNYWVTASASGFDAATQGNVAVIADDTTQADFALTATVSIARGTMPAAARSFTVTQIGNTLRIRLVPSDRTRTFTMHNLQGATVYRTVVPARAAEITVPARGTTSSLLMRLEPAMRNE